MHHLSNEPAGIPAEMIPQITALPLQENTTNSTNIRQTIITIACLGFFPLMYFIGKFVVDFLT
jgi:hypothetical protein